MLITKKEIMEKFKYIIFIKLLLFSCFKIIAQQNLIPNGGFENNTWPTTLCDGNTGDFNSMVQHWKIAEHNNDNGPGFNNTSSQDGADIAIFGNCTMGDCHCSSVNVNPNQYNDLSFKYARIRANVDQCSGSQSNNLFHEAIGVSLENGTSLTNGVTYILRYKICAIRAETASNDNQTCGTFNTDFSHIRFFLATNGPANWENGTVQELIASNYQKQLSTTFNGSELVTPCNWEQVEKTFTAGVSNLKTLIIYAERGGALIDDVELFEQCRQIRHVQNRNFANVLFAANAVSGNNYRDKASQILLIGNNVDNTMLTGKVSVQNGAVVNFTANDEVRIYNGFEAKLYSEVKITNFGCSSFYNRETNNTNQEIEGKLDFENTELKDYRGTPTLNNSEITKIDKTLIYPNPTNSSFKIKLDPTLGLPSEIKIIDRLGTEIETINPSKFLVEIDLQNKSGGMYFINISYTDKTITRKIIKN